VSARILLVDDDLPTCELLASVLRAEGHEATWETRGEAALRRVNEQDFDVVLADVSMDGMDGIQLCSHLHQLKNELPVILVTGHASLDAAVGALRAGAYDFLQKPIDVKLLLPAVARAVRHHSLDREVKRLRRALADTQRFGELIGSSPAMEQVFDLIARVAESDASVLITGESGTGKELVARSIHQHSRRRESQFVAVNCAAVPSTLIESELFGHVRGAFTDAKANRPGLFVQADGGTLFLDEVGELPLEVQPKLLRALQERVVRPVGASEEVPFDARVITASNRDLEASVEGGTFRGDLLYRIDVVRVELPPLRARGRDVLLLAQQFVDSYAAKDPSRAGTTLQLDRAAAEKLLAYDWPGNVRELENCIERAVALARGANIGLEDLPQKVREHHAKHVVVSTEDPSDVVTLDELERRYIVRVLEMMGGNKTQAAKMLGLDRRTLYRRLARHGLA
jgi:two-component system response regulator HydG